VSQAAAGHVGLWPPLQNVGLGPPLGPPLCVERDCPRPRLSTAIYAREVTIPASPAAAAAAAAATQAAEAAEAALKGAKEAGEAGVKAEGERQTAGREAALKALREQHVRACVRACVCVCAFVRACVRSCVCARVRVCQNVRVDRLWIER
jgi:hypothetical protein